MDHAPRTMLEMSVACFLFLMAVTSGLMLFQTGAALNDTAYLSGKSLDSNMQLTFSPISGDGTISGTVIAATGNSFDVQMEHGSKKYVPVYDDPTRPETFRGSYEVHYDMFYNAQILPVLFPNSAVAKDDPMRRYKLHVGDTFTVTVKNTNRTPGTILFDFLNQAISSNEIIFIPYGGVVRNEMD